MAPVSKSPAFVALVGLMALLLAMSLFMYTQLETISRDDDLNLVVLGGGSHGGGGSDGGGGGGFDLRKQRHHEKKKKHHKKGRHGSRDDGGGAGDGMMASIGRMMRGGDALENFQGYKDHEAKRRAKMGVLTTREEFEQQQGQEAYGTNDDDELKSKAQKLRVADIPTVTDDLPYDIHNCPAEPPTNYPYQWNVRNVLENWNPDNTDLPSRIYQGLCVFDWTSEEQREIAFQYRSKEVPFVLQHVPEVSKAAIRWNSKGYLKNLIGDEPIRNEHSKNNHFMYWKTRYPTPDFIPPTDMTELTYEDWYTHALEVDKLSAEEQKTQEHWYFRLNAMYEKHGYAYEELPFFDPTLGETMTVVTPEAHRGINCRFGMKGVIAETHFDSSNNFIAVMGGQRRYILAHPNQCEGMELYPQEHPSGRHASIDWSTFDFENDKSNRPFTRALVNEVVMQAGDLLYLPTYWFHFIVSLNLNYQCNSRSGDSSDYEQDIADCGFMPVTARKHKK